MKEFWEGFPKVGLPSDLHCWAKVLHFRSVALAFFFFDGTSSSAPICTNFSPFQQLHSSPCIIVDFPWWICAELFWVLHWLLCCCNPIVIVLIFKALLLKLLRPNFLILSLLTTAIIVPFKLFQTIKAHTDWIWSLRQDWWEGNVKIHVECIVCGHPSGRFICFKFRKSFFSLLFSKERFVKGRHRWLLLSLM